MTNNISESRAASLLSEAEDILLLAHQYPDGDTLGSNYAMYRALRSVGKRVRIECADPLPERYDYMPMDEPFEDFEPRFICAIDVADDRLLGKELQEKYGNRVNLCIDHHATNVEYAENTCVDGNSAAAAMIVYRILRLMNIPMDKDIAQCLYTGIATDTGCFKYSNADSNAHRIAADCIDFGINYDMINRVNFDIKSRARIELERQALENMKFYFDGRVAVMVIDNEMVASSKAKENDLEGLPPIPRQIEGVWVGITLRQKADGFYKISVRTGTHANASDICARLGGGGHMRAAGCSIEGTLEEARTAILKAVEEAIPRITTG